MAQTVLTEFSFYAGLVCGVIVTSILFAMFNLIAIVRKYRQPSKRGVVIPLKPKPPNKPGA